MIFIIHTNVSFNPVDDLNYCQVIALVDRNEEVIACRIFLISFIRYNINFLNEFTCSKFESGERN